jgi:hypothetical protein
MQGPGNVALALVAPLNRSRKRSTIYLSYCSDSTSRRHWSAPLGRSRAHLQA